MRLSNLITEFDEDDDWLLHSQAGQSTRVIEGRKKKANYVRLFSIGMKKASKAGITNRVNKVETDSPPNITLPKPR